MGMSDGVHVGLRVYDMDDRLGTVVGDWGGVWVSLDGYEGEARRYKAADLLPAGRDEAPNLRYRSNLEERLADKVEALERRVEIDLADLRRALAKTAENIRTDIAALSEATEEIDDRLTVAERRLSPTTSHTRPWDNT